MKNILLFLIAIAVLFEPSLALATTDADLITKVYNEYNKLVKSGYDVVQNFALNLFYLILTFQIVWLGIQGIYDKTEIQGIFRKLIQSLVTACFFLAVINNYAEWSKMMINGLFILSGDIVPIQTESTTPFHIGLQIMDKINTRVEALSWRQMGVILTMYFCGILNFIIFALITVNILIIKCEVLIANLAVLALVPLGASSLFKEYGKNTITYVLSVAFKLFVMQLVIGIGFSFIENFKFSNADMQDIALILGFSIVLLALSKKLPDMVAGIIHGTHNSADTGLKGALTTTATLVKHLVKNGIGNVVRGGIRGYQASKVARAEGARGLIGNTFGTIKAMHQARQQAQVRRTNMGIELQDRLNTIGALS